MTRTTGEVSRPAYTWDDRANASQGNYVSFTFNGTAVFIYGSKRFNHGVYSGKLEHLHLDARSN
jgi:hypothetical protein